MKENVIKKLKVIEEEEDMNKLIVGEYFLYGRNIVNQVENKKPGDPITYYKIINKHSKGVEYTPIYDYLEKD
jgi:hypothetical protein